MKQIEDALKAAEHAAKRYYDERAIHYTWGEIRELTLAVLAAYEESLQKAKQEMFSDG